jgi:hypothetical protein
MRHTSLNARSIVPFFVLLTVIGLASCGSQNGGPSSGGQNVSIDWVNFIRFNGITYLATSMSPQDGLPASQLGPVFDTVKFKLDGNVHDPNYQMKDGDSAFLAAGTQIYTVKGYKSTFRLAAHLAGHIQLYEVNTNPQARTGADLLDIGSKVLFIGIISSQNGATQLGAIKDSHKIVSLVNMVLASPVDVKRIGQGSMTYLIAFHLQDGTSVIRAYWQDSGIMERGIMLPKAFADAVQQAVVK